MTKAGTPPYFFGYGPEEHAAMTFLQTLVKPSEAFPGGGMPQENMQRYSHGRMWSHRAARSEDEPEMMEDHSADFVIHLADVVNGNILALDQALSSLRDQVNAEMAKTFYRTISDAADHVGNVVSQKDHANFPQAFLAMLKAIEFGVDRQGRVTFPEMHASPEVAAKMVAELDAQPPDFHEEVERVKAEKSEAALERERLRRARFRQPTGGA